MQSVRALIFFFLISSVFASTDQWKECELKVYDHWTVSVRARQQTLGCGIITAHRQGIERISDLTADEILELKEVMKDFEEAVDICFQPDRFNYLQLGNALHQLHFHVIPRYSTSRQFAGIEWVDVDFGQPIIFRPERPSMEMVPFVRDTLLQVYSKK